MGTWRVLCEFSGHRCVQLPALLPKVVKHNAVNIQLCTIVVSYIGAILVEISIPCQRQEGITETNLTLFLASVGRASHEVLSACYMIGIAGAHVVLHTESHPYTSFVCRGGCGAAG